MATVNALVHRHHRKSDGSYNVKIRVFHHEKKYIETEHYITDRQLRPDGTIKDTFILSLLNHQLDDYRETISRLGDRIELYSAERLRDYLRDKDKPIDFAAFCKEVIDFRMANKQKGSARTFRSVRFSLIDYFGRESVSVMEIHSDMLREYEAYLRTERTITRPDQFGIPKTRKVKGMTDIGLHNHMRDLRALFNLAAKKYNNKSLGITRT
ncbi:phage integrase SAM-like domain-containing protein [Olivibacter sp. CPCC 100613]|uniref:phage integrase SAM-like domain-containing protein n=1 Tax=Olivibacter sp. CPCC 100613 TaxID=3079931 RepID=UPI002FF891C7